MHPITQRVKELETEMDELEKKIHTIIYEIQEIRYNCNHLNSSGYSAFEESSYDGLNKIYECSICGKRTRKIN